MLKFYQQARALKTQRYTVNDSSLESMAESMAREALMLRSKPAKTLKRDRLKHSIVPSQKLHGLQATLDRQEEPQLKFNLFKNVGIKRKLKEMQLCKGQQKIKKRLVKQTVELKKYEASVHQYLIKKIKQKIQKSQEEKIKNRPLTYQPGTRKGQIRYKTLNDQNTERHSQEFINTVGQNGGSTGNKKIMLKRQMKISGRNSSNLITHDQSLLAHIIRRQKEFQQKSLKIVVMNNRHSLYHKQSCEQAPLMALTSQKWRMGKRKSESRTNNLKAKSISSYKASEYVIALRKEKKSTDNLIRPWDSQSKEES